MFKWSLAELKQSLVVRPTHGLSASFQQCKKLMWKPKQNLPKWDNLALQRLKWMVWSIRSLSQHEALKDASSKHTALKQKRAALLCCIWRSLWDGNGTGLEWPILNYVVGPQGPDLRHCFLSVLWEMTLLALNDYQVSSWKQSCCHVCGKHTCAMFSL